MSDTLIISGLSLNFVFLLGIAYSLGRYAQRIDAAEKRIVTIEDAKTEVGLATLSSDVKHLTGLVGAMGSRVEVIANWITKRHTTLSAADGD